jgi:hypothetical protein
LAAEDLAGFDDDLGHLDVTGGVVVACADPGREEVADLLGGEVALAKQAFEGGEGVEQEVRFGRDEEDERFGLGPADPERIGAVAGHDVASLTEWSWSSNHMAARHGSQNRPEAGSWVAV